MIEQGLLISSVSLTKRAPDVWDSAAFSSIFLASGFSYTSGIIHARPHAGNANRWGACVLRSSFFTKFDRQEKPTPACGQRGPNGELDVQLHFAIYGAKIKCGVAESLWPRPMWPKGSAPEPGEAA